MDNSKEAMHRRFFDQLEEQLDLDDSQNGWQIDFGLHSELFESWPIARTGQFEIELESVVGDIEGARSPVQFVFNIEDVLSEIIFGRGIGLAL